MGLRRGGREVGEARAKRVFGRASFGGFGCFEVVSCCLCVGVTHVQKGVVVFQSDGALVCRDVYV